MLTVLSVAYPFAPVSRDAVGGAEQVVAALDAGLVARGHRSIVVAAAGSQVAGTLVPLPASSLLIDDAVRARTHAEARAAIARVLATTPVDVVHLHGLDFAAYAPAGVRTIVTLHLPAAWYAPASFAVEATFVCVSESQRRDCPVPALVVGNGVDVAAFRARRTPGRYALALGRICREKAFEHAVAAATRAGVPLLVAGQVFGYVDHLRYFEEELRPRLTAPHRWLGPIGGARKRRLLAGARCVVVPSRVAETSSLVAMEALASGTPVVAQRAGALPELVEHGVTGFVVEGDDEMATAIGRARELSRATCRRVAAARFAAARMIDEYVTLYAAHARPRRAASAVEIVVSLDELERLRADWAALWSRLPAATPFQRPEWLLAWWRHLGGGRPHAVVVRDGGRVVAMVPLVIGDDGAVRLAGGGVSDYLDALVEPAAAPWVARVVSDVLARAARPCLVEDLPADGFLARAPLDGAAAALPDKICPGLPLPADAPFDAALPAGFRGRLAYARRRAARERLVAEDVDARTLPEFLDALFALHRARWRVRGQEGVLADAAVERFHRDAAPGLFGAGLLAMHAVRDAGGRIVAVSYGFVAGARASLYASGFSPELASRSPGALVIARAVERAHADGARYWDFLRGAEPYKYDWGARDQWTMRRLLHGRGAPKEPSHEHAGHPLDHR